MFAGIGGFRSGLSKFGDFFMPIGFCEIDPYARRAYEAIYDTKGELFFEDARKIVPEELPDIDLICGGFPCQSFSIAGKRGGFEDARGTLFFEIARIARVKRPKYLLLENVPGLLSHDSGKTFATILGTLSELGYDVAWQVLNSADFGIPQSRKRVFLAFSGCSGLTSITIPDSVTIIGENVFEDCSGLTSVTIPDSVTGIDSTTFKGCSGLTSITVTTGNTTYHSAGNCLIETASKTLIWGCKNSVMPTDGSVKSIDGGAFWDCSGLTSITIPDSVTSIGASAFKGCSGLTSITIPDSVTSIGPYAFEGCSRLTSVTIPNSVTSIGYSAFEGCSGLTSITIPDSVTSIDRDTFKGCSRLTSITIPDSVTSIDSTAFEDCIELTSITVATGNTAYHSAGNCLIKTASKTLILGCKNSKIPTDGSVKYIGKYAFSGCSRLTSITIPDSVTSIGSGAFSNCSRLTSITIPDSVTSIGSGAFSHCSGLTSITIPDSVTSIGSRAFEDCIELTSITVATGNTTYHSAGNCLIETASKTLILGCKNSKIPTDGSVKHVGEYAFSGCSRLTSISIPDSVTSIGSGAFSHCSGLTSITIPDSVTSIGASAFSGCSGLTSITIPNSVTSIGDFAFNFCSSLKSIVFSDTSTWFRRSSSFSCETITSLENATQNAIYFTFLFEYYDWYKR